MTYWPRGISKEKIDSWRRELGTPKELIRDWKDGKVQRREYVSRYKKSLEGKDELLEGLAEEARRGTVTLLCSCKDPNRCHRSILKQILEKRL
jgi:uncharacterized protein YeaO (DUF488 family)